MFPYLTYANPYKSFFSKKINVGFIYTMNATEKLMNENILGQYLINQGLGLKLLFGNLETLYSFDTYQFDDYSKFVSDLFDPEQKAKRREEVFPIDCQKAFELGKRAVVKDL